MTSHSVGSEILGGTSERQLKDKIDCIEICTYTVSSSKTAIHKYNLQVRVQKTNYKHYKLG